MDGKEQALYNDARVYSARECYWILYDGLRTMRHMAAARRSGNLSQDFSERIMLAVTAVNRCAACSYAHTRMALAAGLADDEVRDLLCGSLDCVPAEQAAAVAFAQHYAENRGHPADEAWQRVVERYGAGKAMGILGAVRTIMIGNAYGIPLSAFLNRLRGKVDARSSLSYELGMMVGAVVVAPIALVHATIAALAGVPVTLVAEGRISDSNVTSPR